MLIDKALTVLGLRPVAARGTSPPSGRAGLWRALHTGASRVALSRRRSRQPSLSYEQSPAANEIRASKRLSRHSLGLGAKPAQEGSCEHLSKTAAHDEPASEGPGI